MAAQPLQKTETMSNAQVQDFLRRNGAVPKGIDKAANTNLFVLRGGHQCRVTPLPGGMYRVMTIAASCGCT